MNILIAEDEEDIAFSYKQALEERHHNVTITYNGEDCLKIYKEKLQTVAEENDNLHTLDKSPLPFDVVILDYKMSKRDGLQVAKDIFELKADQRIIFASAYVKSTLEESLRHLEQLVEVIQKPFDVKALIDTIEDKEVSDGLKMLMSSMSQIKHNEIKGGLDPTEEQIRGLLDGMRRIQKGRTF